MEEERLSEEEEKHVQDLIAEIIKTLEELKCKKVTYLELIFILRDILEKVIRQIVSAGF